VCEARPGAWQPNPERGQPAEVGVEADPSQRDDDAHVLEQGQLGHEIAGAALELSRERAIARRRAVQRSRDVSVDQAEAVAAVP
jgi:hypothetical protein